MLAPSPGIIMVLKASLQSGSIESTVNQWSCQSDSHRESKSRQTDRQAGQRARLANPGENVDESSLRDTTGQEAKQPEIQAAKPHHQPASQPVSRQVWQQITQSCPQQRCWEFRFNTKIIYIFFYLLY